MNGNCRIEDCDRHELWGGMCLDHLKESLDVDQPKRKRRTKKVDAVELLTTDDVKDLVVTGAEAGLKERNDNDK